MKEEIIKALEEVVKKLTGKNIKVSLSIPKDTKNGDWASNIAFQLSKELGTSPLEAAQKVVDLLQENGKFSGIISLEAVNPGFINFYLKNTELSSNAKGLLNSPEKVGKSSKLKNKRVIVEFTDPNPFKELHIGHVYSNTIGQAICRLLESQGAEVKRANYQGDIGLHVAKALWGMQQLDPEMPSEKASLSEKAHFLGKAYARGASAYDKDEIVKHEIGELNKKVYGKDPTVMGLYEKGRAWSLEYFDSVYQRLGMKFDYFYFESVAGPVGLEYIKEHMKDEIFEEHDGAIIFRGEKYGLHTRVFVNSQGLPTYEAKELGLAPTKYKDYQYDESIIITGNEINEYFKVLLKVLSLINPDLASKTKHMGHGMVRLSSGKKMSSRSGNVITGEEVLDEAKSYAAEKIQEQVKSTTLTSEERDMIAEAVGVGAIKYAFLKSSIGKDVAFSFEESVSFEGNAGPYVQYAYTRTQSILGKARENSSEIPQNYSPQKEEGEILRKIYHFGEIVEEAATTYSPNVVTEYLFELSQLFNNFYQKYRILNAPTDEEKSFRLGLTAGVGIVLKQGLYLLGIQAPEKM